MNYTNRRKELLKTIYLTITGNSKYRYYHFKYEKPKIRVVYKSDEFQKRFPENINDFKKTWKNPNYHILGYFSISSFLFWVLRLHREELTLHEI